MEVEEQSMASDITHRKSFQRESAQPDANHLPSAPPLVNSIESAPPYHSLFVNSIESAPCHSNSLRKDSDLLETPSLQKNNDLLETPHPHEHINSVVYDSDLLETPPSKTKATKRSIFNRKNAEVKKDKKMELWRVMAGMEEEKKEGRRKKREQRFATKTGLLNINYINLPGLKRKLFKDMFHTIMDAKWRYFMLLFTMSFLVTWVLFAAVWYLIVYLRTENCVDNVATFAEAFLFSIETQVTIGYGGRAVTDKCPEGVILLIVQTIIGTFINCALLGVLFAKLARPKNRGKTIVFSRRAIITLRDGKYCFIYRYVDLRERKLLDSNMRLIIIKPRMTKEGQDLPLDMMDLPVTIDYKQVEFTVRLFPIYPINIIHIIDEDSPLYTITRARITNAEFEILAILEGTVPGTGNTTQALTSYKPKEIDWGKRFTPVWIGIKKGQTNNCIDLSTLDKTYEENTTPDYSAKEHDKTKGSSSSSSSSSSQSPKKQKGSSSSSESPKKLKGSKRDSDRPSLNKKSSVDSSESTKNENETIVGDTLEEGDIVCIDHKPKKETNDFVEIDIESAEIVHEGETDPV